MIENKYLERNTELEALLTKATAEPAPEIFEEIEKKLTELMNADCHFLVPVEYADEDQTSFTYRFLDKAEGETFLPLFTSEEELHKGHQTDVISFFMDIIIETVLTSTGTKGVVINPWGNGIHIEKHALWRIIEEKRPEERDYEWKNSLINRAIHYATDKHSGQVRKGTQIPYITHPLEVYTLLTDIGADANLRIAGLLHDVLEDTDTTSDELIWNFGYDVARLASGHTDDKSLLEASLI